MSCRHGPELAKTPGDQSDHRCAGRGSRQGANRAHAGRGLRRVSVDGAENTSGFICHGHGYGECAPGYIPTAQAVKENDGKPRRGAGSPLAPKSECARRSRRCCGRKNDPVCLRRTGFQARPGRPSYGRRQLRESSIATIADAAIVRLKEPIPTFWADVCGDMSHPSHNQVSWPLPAVDQEETRLRNAVRTGASGPGSHGDGGGYR